MYKHYKFILITALSPLVIIYLFLSLTGTAKAAAFADISITLSNSRLSYKALISSGSSGSSLVTIQSGSSDATTKHLFPGDVLCFTDAGQNGCRDNTTYTVASIIDDTHFNLTAPLASALVATDYAVASQSATWSVAFTTVAQVPIGGSILITIPMADNANGNNGIPDNSGTTANSGFDLNKLVSGNVTITGCTDANWGSAAINPGSGTSDHTISFTRATSACAASTAITITIGGNGIVNPAAVTSGHTQGAADVYGIPVVTKDDSSNVLDYATQRVAPIEAVLISGNVDESLSFVVAGTGVGTSHCGFNSSITTTATSVAWGHFAAANTFYYAAQNLTVNTNAASGYSVTIQENDQMGKDGNVCTGTAPSADNYTFGSGICIRDTVCQSSNCSESITADWTNAVGYPGLGYSEASITGSIVAPFYYNEKTRTFSTKQLADKQGGETPAVIMSSTGPVSSDSVDVCYRITVPGTQPAGYYYNLAKYTVTATF